MHDTGTLKLKQLNGIQASFILLFTRAFPTVTCQNGFRGKRVIAGASKSAMLCS